MLSMLILSFAFNANEIEMKIWGILFSPKEINLV